MSNWKTQEMSFVLNGEQHTIEGHPSLTRSRISLKVMIRALHKKGGGLWLEFKRLEDGGESAENKPDIQ